MKTMTVNLFIFFQKTVSEKYSAKTIFTYSVKLLFLGKVGNATTEERGAKNKEKV